MTHSSSSTPTPTWYDGLLAAMPTLLVGGAAVGWLSALPTVAGLAGGGLVAAVLVSVSLFIVPPT
ncbi:uncharacterized protein Nmlp_2141 [Natronomonas moolapensis 8.8.11]|uniref:Uncharacterized protein n=1 Tax=Natronomonas moolapensis (strain DSM 18674 / CECT 7526 / JCM 14361 / 8.8.11) TaxID=268739 RepID=M1XQF5_NATM8|nr:hypothetical protein [Natronomonas moolapensis]CCQ36321.1 uncharacterized protein Nmlp_2141 [Natronomonas moolapensis 8.8.11]